MSELLELDLLPDHYHCEAALTEEAERSISKTKSN